MCHPTFGCICDALLVLLLHGLGGWPQQKYEEKAVLERHKHLLLLGKERERACGTHELDVASCSVAIVWCSLSRMLLGTEVNGLGV